MSSETLLIRGQGRTWRADEGRLVRCDGATGPHLVEAGEDAVVAAGRINAHTHIYSGLAPLGMPAPAVAPENFVQILERIWWRLDRALDEDSLRASARLYVADSLLRGTTTLIDHHESPNLIEGSLSILADACRELGMRAVLCYGATERNFGRDEGRRGLAECERFIKGLGGDSTLRGMVALHASFTVSDDCVREAGDLCRSLKVPMHVHLAEDGADVVDAKERGFAGPLERLVALDALPAGSLLAHGVHLTPAQVADAAARGAWFVQNPRSNKGNRVGFAKALVNSADVALGTDGWEADMLAEAAALRVEAAGVNPPSALEARITGARRLVGQLFGSVFCLSEGSAADVIVEGPEGVRDVVVNGRLVVRGGQLLTGDLEAIRAHAREAAAALWKRMAAL